LHQNSIAYKLNVVSCSDHSDLIS